MKKVAIESLSALMNAEDVTLIDVRTPAEYQSVHVQGAVNIPLDELSGEALCASRKTPEETVFLICQSGTRARTACAKLKDAENIAVVEGGTQAWLDRGYPVVEGKQSISLERQVRIVAGSLVFLATGLGVLVSPYFLLVSGFVGAGLVFAGVTDSCGMAMILGKCPWNRVSTHHRPSEDPA